MNAIIQSSRVVFPPQPRPSGQLGMGESLGRTWRRVLAHRTDLPCFLLTTLFVSSLRHSAVTPTRLAAALVVAFTTPSAGAQNPAPIRYELRIVPRADRTDLAIEARFAAGTDQRMTVGLPEDSEYGTSGLFRFVSGIEGIGGTTVSSGKDSSERVVAPGTDGTVGLRYVLSFGPGVFGDATYAPNVGNGHIHLAGAQWLLRIGSASESHRFEVAFRDIPGGWHPYSSLGADPARLVVTATRKELGRSVVGAVTETNRQFTAGGKPVSVFIQGKYAQSHDSIVDAVRRIVTAQRALFGEADDYFTVVILPRVGNVAGVATSHNFTCFLKDDVAAQQMYWLLAHEMMHTWMTRGRVALGPDSSGAETFVTNQWFIEGVNDFLARRMMADVGLLTADGFADLINRDIINLAENPNRAKPLVQVMADANSGLFGVAYTKMSYYRGALIALKWESDMRAARRREALAAVVQRVLAEAGRHDSHLSWDAFHELLAPYGINARGDIKRFVTDARPMQVPPGALGAEFELAPMEIPAFDPGFSVAETARSRVVTGVVVGGPAHQAGVRNGMPYVGTENGNRFSNAWDPEKPMRVTVRLDGALRVIAFMPRGAALRHELFRKRAPG